MTRETRQAMMSPQTIILALGLVANGGVSYYGKSPADTSKIENNKDRSKKNEWVNEYQQKQIDELRLEVRKGFDEVNKNLKEALQKKGKKQ